MMLDTAGEGLRCLAKVAQGRKNLPREVNALPSLGTMQRK